MGALLDAYGIYKGQKDRKSKDERKKDAGSAASGGYVDYNTGDSYKRGGKVRKTGLARLHKGERVITVKAEQKRKRSGKSRS
jgi:hypothetical protein